MFQLLDFTEAHVATVTNRQETHGDEKVPAVSIGLEITAANTILDAIDPKLRHALYVAVDEQPALPGVEPSTPVLRCNSIDRAALPTKLEGWTLQVDDGIDATEPMTFCACKVDKFSAEPKQGGSVVLRMRVGTSDVDQDRLGALGMHNGQSIWIKLTAPEKPADAIDGSVDAFKKDHPDATDLFSEGGEDSDSEGGETDVDPLDGTDKVRDVTLSDGAEATLHSATRSPAGSRTARGREKTKAALEEGAAT